MNNVIACIDGSAISTSVCDAAAWAATKLSKPLLLLHTLEKLPVPPLMDDLSGSLGLSAQEQLLRELTDLDEQRSRLALEHGRRLLEEAKLRSEQQGAKEVYSLQRHGDILESLSDLQQDARVFVLGRAGLGHQNQANVVGSHVENAVRTLDRPVLVTTGEFNAPKNFMIAYDGRETADNAIKRVVSSDLLQGLPCHLVMVANNRAASEEQLQKAKSLLEGNGFQVTAEYLHGEISQTLQDYKTQNSIDLLVMGAYASSKVRQFFVGSNTTKMIAQATTTLLLLR